MTFPRCGKRECRPGGKTCWECLPGSQGDGFGKGWEPGDEPKSRKHELAANRAIGAGREAKAKEQGRAT